MHLLLHTIQYELSILLVGLELLLRRQLRRHTNYSILYEMQWLYAEEKILFRNYFMMAYFPLLMSLGMLRILYGKLQHSHLQRLSRSLYHSIIKYGHINEVHYFLLDDFLGIHSSLILRHHSLSVVTDRSSIFSNTRHDLSP